MGLVSNCIVKVHKVEPYKADWIKNEQWVLVKATVDCNGKRKVIERPFQKSQWNDIEEEGFYISSNQEADENLK